LLPQGGQIDRQEVTWPGDLRGLPEAVEQPALGQ